MEVWVDLIYVLSSMESHWMQSWADAVCVTWHHSTHQALWCRVADLFVSYILQFLSLCDASVVTARTLNLFDVITESLGVAICMFPYLLGLRSPWGNFRGTPGRSWLQPESTYELHVFLCIRLRLLCDACILIKQADSYRCAISCFIMNLICSRLWSVVIMSHFLHFFTGLSTIWTDVLCPLEPGSCFISNNQWKLILNHFFQTLKQL